MKDSTISRRDFLKKSMIGLGGIALFANQKNTRLLENLSYLEEFPDAEYFARNTVYSPNTLPIRLKPSADSAAVRNMGNDECLVWYREVIGTAPTGRTSNNRWVETPEGYVYLPSVQKVRNIPNQPVAQIPDTGEGQGMWAEVTVPYVKMTLENPPARAPWLNEVPSDLWRMYYSQVVWIDQMSADADGVVYYRVNEDYGHGYGYGDIFWAEASAFRPITEAEISPIHPEVTDKNIIVNVNQQTLSCYEGATEVYFCRVSTGRKLDDNGLPADEWATPIGDHWIWRKTISLHMSGGGTGAGWDTMAVPWTSLFVGTGVSIHATFWHSDFGTARSHGCVNASPEDAKWIFRWTTPYISLVPGDQTASDYSGTMIHVKEPLY
ncbi:MAG: L,D-transpeptidase [Anaerolineaceae bacterium]|jgi:lipoprotein-anchoring transpeptidase ErfK/SrfK|nr:MAG: L,D-transpeptidase [Anaerolineaceae bacterium]